MKKLYHLLLTRYKLRVTSYKLQVTSYKLRVTNLFCRISDIGYRISFIAFLFFPFSVFAQATVTEVLYSCPGQITVTYNLNSVCAVDVTLEYSYDCETWTEAHKVEGDLEKQTGTGIEDKTIVWNNAEEGEGGVVFGKFYFRVEYPGSEQEPVEHAYIEIAGLKWATCNVAKPGFFADSPSDTGWYYQWGINVGWRPSPDTPLFNSDGGTIWNTSPNSNMPQGWLCDPCPVGWRLPTIGEYEDLFNYVVHHGSSFDRLKGQNGRFFDNGDPCQPLLFLPVAGYRNSPDGRLTLVSTYGQYWSSMQGSNSGAFYFRFSTTTTSFSGNGSKGSASLIRCVAEE